MLILFPFTETIMNKTRQFENEKKKNQQKQMEKRRRKKSSEKCSIQQFTEKSRRKSIILNCNNPVDPRQNEKKNLHVQNKARQSIR